MGWSTAKGGGAPSFLFPQMNHSRTLRNRNALPMDATGFIAEFKQTLTFTLGLQHLWRTQLSPTHNRRCRCVSSSNYIAIRY